MRVWEFDDTRVIPTNLVLEQDFILKIRRLNRTGAPHLVANILLSEVPSDYAGRGTLEDAHSRLQSLCAAQNGHYYGMSNGDIFVVWPLSAPTEGFLDQLMMVSLPESTAHPADKEKYLRVFSLPEDYARLRAQADDYVAAMRSGASAPDENAPDRLLKSDAARGTLTAWTVNQIDRLFRDIDLCPFIRSQAVYEKNPDGTWTPLFDEAYMGLHDLRAAYFPHTQIEDPPHLFLDMCRALDRSLLQTLRENYNSISDMALTINLSSHSVLGSAFTQFAHRVPRGARGRIGFEIQIGELIQDFPVGLNALDVLRQEGFRVTIDGLTPQLMPYLYLPRFEADFFKINADKDHAPLLRGLAFREAARTIPPEKIILFRCDTQEALDAGRDNGITRFQGWLVDDLARAWRGTVS